MSTKVGTWAAFVVLAGLLAMHGLAAHGALDTPPPTAVAAHAVTHDAPHHDGSPGHDRGAMSSMATCVAVLSLGLLLLGLALVLLRTARRGWLTARVVRRALLERLRARAPDPPDLWTLSVCRC